MVREGQVIDPTGRITTEFIIYHLIASTLSAANRSRSSNAGLMLAQRRRQWTSIKSTLAQRFVFPVLFPGKHHTLKQRWCKTGPAL